MSKYRFRLETLAKLRIAQRDQHRAALADGYRAEQILAEQRTALAEEAAAVRELQRTALAAPYANVSQLVESQRYALVVHARQQMLQDQAARLAVEVERRRLALVEADRAVRALEKLDERRHDEHRQHQARVAQKELDEVASVCHHNV